MFQIRWKNSRPYGWQATMDGGATWRDLQASDDGDSSEAVDEAAETFGVLTNQWQLIDD